MAAAITTMLLPKLESVTQILVDYVIPPTPTKLCGSEGGPPITAKRVQLKDGRHLAYAEYGVNKADAKFKMIFCHGFTGSRLDSLNASQELMEELGVYIVGFDRAGYGESDPNPYRSVRSAFRSTSSATTFITALDMHALVRPEDNTCFCLTDIDSRLEAVVLMAPVVNHRWPRFPRKLAREVYRQQELGDQWSLQIAHYAPSILHWWLEQSWLPASTVIKGTTPRPNKFDAELNKSSLTDGSFEKRIHLASQQGRYESLYREPKVMFGKWEFDPMNLTEPPFPVHLFQGAEDGLVPVILQRYIASQLSWIKYHELPSTGHDLKSVKGFGDELLKTVLCKRQTFK